jgi:hypothetical protein
MSEHGAGPIERAVYFFPDEQTGAPHAVMGMETAFTVA